ncbi:MAG: protein kinase [Anaerolineales bacterium]|nr:protein kinase [Anaerolineales bacterium]
MPIIAERYELQEMIGRGGMGTVYKGYDTQTRQTVAIKSLDALVVARDPGLVERFRREGEILAELKHPNIVRAVAAVEENDEHYLIMEYVSGGSLQGILEREGRLPVKRVVEIALDLTDALTRAHRLKIIHRDLKPANVLIASDGTPRLTDFGIARITDGTRITETGSLMGTYAYLSPEACQGQRLDARADIWSFGVMLYELLTGQTPFETDNAAAILIAILQREPTDIRELNPSVPEPLAILIHAMLIKDREQRISSTRRVGAELEAILASLDGEIYESSSTPLPSRFADTPTNDEPIVVTTATTTPEPILTLPEIKVYAPLRSVRSLLSIGLLLIIAAIAVGTWTLGRKDNDDNETQPDSNIQVVVPNDAANYAVLIAELESLDGSERDIVRFIVDDLEQKFEREIPFANIKIYIYPGIIQTQNDALAVAEANNAPIIIWGNYTTDMIELDIQLGSLANYPDIQIERDQIEELTDVRVHLQDPRQETIAHYILGIMGMLQTTEGDSYGLLRTLAIIAEVKGMPAQIVGESTAALTHRFYRGYISDTAYALQAIAAAQRMNPGNPILYIFSASAHLRDGNLTQAKRDMETAMRLDGAGQISATRYGLLANIAIYEDNIPQAISYYNEIVALRPDDWFPYNFRAALYYNMGDYSQAEADYSKAFAHHPTASFPYPYSTMIALRQGEPERARDLIEESLRQFPDSSLAARTSQAIFGENYPLPFGPLFSAYGNLALGRYEEMLDNVADGFAVDPDNVELYFMAGLAQCNLEDYDAALESLNTAIEIDPEFAVLYVIRAGIYFNLGDMTATLRDVETAREILPTEQMDYLIQTGLEGEINCTNYFSVPRE